MSTFFSPEGKLYKFISRFWDVIKLNFCWFLCCIPIVTFGPATVAAYSVTLKMVDDEEGYVCRQFFKAFKKNMKQGIPLGLIFLGLCYIIWFEFSNYEKLDSIPLFIGGIIVSFLTYFHFVYAFALSARYENTLWHTIKNSNLVAVRYIGRTFLMTCLLVIEAIALLYLSEKFFNLLYLIIGPTCVMFTISWTAMRCFREIERTGGVMPEKPTVQEAVISEMYDTAGREENEPEESTVEAPESVVVEEVGAEESAEE